MIFIAIAAVLSFLIKAIPVFLASNAGLEKGSFIIRMSSKSNFMILGALIFNGLFSVSLGEELNITEFDVYAQGVVILIATVVVSIFLKSIYASVAMSAGFAAIVFIAFNGF